MLLACYFVQMADVDSSGVRAFENGLTSAGWNSLTREFGVEHNLQFIAPEQTGRLSSSPDSRTDIYSLGIIFYNLLTGEAPFHGATPLEIMQNVLSRRVPAVSSKRADVPEALSLVIQKMVEKNIEDRYYSVNGLKWDLKEIQTLLNESACKRLMDFKIGTKDINSTFILPSLLVGREQEQGIILGVIEKVAAYQSKSILSPSKGLAPMSPAMSATQSRRDSVNPVDEFSTHGYSRQNGSSRHSSSPKDVSKTEICAPSKHSSGNNTMDEVPEIRWTQANDHRKVESLTRTHSMTSLEPSIALKTSHKLKRSGRTELICLSGAAGLGKSSIVQSIHPHARSRGYFCSGKFDQLKKIPFEPVLLVMTSLFRQIFSEVDLDTPFHASFRAFILPVWSLVAPMLGLPEFLLHENQRHHTRSPVRHTNSCVRSRRDSSPSSAQTSSSTNGSEVTRNATATKSSRFTAIFINILRFLSASQLLLFCLDDVDHADEESLDLLLNILQAKVPLVLILTCKDKSALSVKAQALLTEDSASVTEIQLGRLTEEHIADYVSKTLHRSVDYSFPLVAVISEKTGGNPFFMREMLQKCYHTQCISFRFPVWTFDLDRVFEVFSAEQYGSQMNNDFIVARLLDLPPSSRTFLAWATLLGRTFSFSLIKRLMLGDPNVNDSRAILRPSPKADLVRKVSQDIIRGLQNAVSAFVIQPAFDDDHFSFCHDRYQQAASSLPECKPRDEMHFSIAQAMLRSRSSTDDDVFDLAGHICASVDLIKARISDRLMYRTLLMHAASKAMGTGGRATALKYYNSASSLLQSQPWEEEFSETLSLFQKQADCCWFEGLVDPALALLQTILQRAHAPIEKVPAYVLLTRIFMHRGDGVSAFRVVKQCLAEMDFKVPDVTWQNCDQNLQILKPKLESLNHSALLSRPLSKNPVLHACASLYGELMASAWYCDSLLFYQVALLEMDLALDKGLTKQAGLALIHVAATLICRFDEIKLGCDLGRLAMELFSADDDECSYVPGRGRALYCMLIGPFEDHISKLLPILDNATERCLAAGENDFALLAIGITAAVKFWSSEDVLEVENYCNWGPEELNDWQDDNRGGVIVIAVRQFCRALAGKTGIDSADTVLSDAQHDRDSYLEQICRRSPNPERTRTTYSTFELAALYSFGHYSAAVKLQMSQNRGFFWSIRFMVSNTFYISMSELAMLREDNPPIHMDKTLVLSGARSRLERLNVWSKMNEVNFAVYAAVLSAQLHEFDGEFKQAVFQYEYALDHAEIHNFTFDQGMTAELYGEFLIRRGANRPAKNMLMDSISYYRKISANGKADQLRGKHEWLIAGTARKVDAACQTMCSIPPTRVDVRLGGDLSCEQAVDEPIMANGDAGALGLDIVDITTLQNTVQILSSELDLGRLLAKMTQLIINFSGAELVAIVVDDEEKEGGLVIAALRDQSESDYPTGEPLSTSPTAQRMLAKSVLVNSIRFSEPYLIPNILEDERFSKLSEEYRYAHHPQGRAVCVVPLSRDQGKVFGCVYLESAANSFTEKIASVLDLLCSPMSVSLTNATLFKQMQKVSASNAVMVQSQKLALASARESEQKAKVAEAEAMRNVRLTEEAVRAKSMFLANVSHELRTPLNGVIGMSELLKGSSLNTEQHEYADSIRVCADTLLTVINDILDFSKLEAGKLQMFSVPLNLTETIAEVVRALSYSNTKKSLKTEMQIELDKDMLVMSDPIRLHQVLMNLLSNSYKFTSQGSVTVRAVVDREDEKEIQVTCSVADTGIGITEEQKQKLFKPFSQADSSTARTYGGTGLGLSIVKAIVEKVMKGRIWLDSIPGQGTTVFFSLKFPKVARGSAAAQDTTRGNSRADPMSLYGPDSENAPLPPDHAAGSIDISKIPRAKIRICIAEDNPINQKIAISYVNRLGYTCQAYSDGRQACDAVAAASAAQKPFHVVLMDVQMPVLDGYDATRELRRSEDPVVKGVVIIAMTASAIRGDREKCLEAGMNNYLAKPVRQNVLKQMLDGYLSHE